MTPKQTLKSCNLLEDRPVEVFGLFLWISQKWIYWFLHVSSSIIVGQAIVQLLLDKRGEVKEIFHVSFSASLTIWQLQLRHGQNFNPSDNFPGLALT